MSKKIADVIIRMKDGTEEYFEDVVDSTAHEGFYVVSINDEDNEGREVLHMYNIDLINSIHLYDKKSK